MLDKVVIANRGEIALRAADQYLAAQAAPRA